MISLQAHHLKTKNQAFDHLNQNHGTIETDNVRVKVYYDGGIKASEFIKYEGSKRWMFL